MRQLGRLFVGPLSEFPNGGARFYVNNGGVIHALASLGSSTNASSFNTWINGTQDFTQYGVSNVAQSSDLGSAAWTFNGVTKTRVFYQTTDGSIRAMMCCSGSAGIAWDVDPTIIANAPLGAVIEAFQASDSTGTAIVLVSWQNALGQLTERWTADINDIAASWSPPIVVST
ncbi:hypothetical protein MVEN_00934100 [Mycena venus]|uniref:Fucose-specific lectin n=1 Tax=Mycena venus TaxID=2733690 RepID=A0A8H6Y832_9AGAR|nr:hypothetical protein MVEN_00934100 [Mycena venus]